MVGEPYRSRPDSRAKGRDVSSLQEDRSDEPERYSAGPVKSFSCGSQTGVQARS